MSIDMSQFYQVFFDEAAEHLAAMETLLLGLDTDAPSMDDLNAIFRAAHSIKGGSGTFGFTDMAETTHVLESLLDKLRKEELALRAEMVDAFLQAGDVIKMQLDGHRGEGEVDPSAAQAVCERLKQLASGETGAAAVPVASACESRRTLLLSFPFAGDAAAFEHLCASLSALGHLEILAAPVQKKGRRKCVPCSLRLVTAVAVAQIQDSLAFVVDPGELTLVEQHERHEQQSASTEPQGYGFFNEAQPVAAPNPGYGFFDLMDNIIAPGQAQPAQAPTAEVVEQGYGFFEEVASPPAASGPMSAAGPRTPAPPVLVQGGRNDKAPASAAASAAASPESSSIRVGVEKVDQLINLVGELVITQAMLAQTASQVDPVIYEKLLNSMSQLERNTRDLQESVMSIRMMPISFVFSRFPRVVRDLASKLNKQVELKTIGEGTELDKGVIEKIADPLTHLVRNSLDHGIETPEQRVAAGKSAKGTITLQAFHQGGNIVVEVRDDGAGLNRERILAKAKERGLPANDGMPDQEVWQLIFEAGFSTAAVVTDVSGRGVGMDVVKRNIQSMGGRVDIESHEGAGTCISIRLPLTLAILDGMSLAVGGETFIIPLTYVVESLQPLREDIKAVAGRGEVLRVRGEYLPLVALNDKFKIPRRHAAIEQGIVVIVETEGRKVALVVDELLGQHQVVIKSLESNYRKVNGVSGATIMGDGRVALILDVTEIVRLAGSAGNELRAAA